MTVLLLVACFAQTPGDDVNSLVAKQQSSLGLLWAVEMDIDTYFTFLIGKDKDVEQHTLQVHWARDATRTRETGIYAPGPDGSPRRHNYHLVSENGAERHLLGWHPSYQDAINKRLPHPVKGEIVPATDSVYLPISIPGASFLLQTMYLGPDDSERSISVAVRDSPEVTLLDEVVDNGRPLRPLRFVHPHTTGEKYHGVAVTVFFDSSIGGLIRKRQIDAPTGVYGTEPSRHVMEIVEVEDRGNGVFVPKAAEATIFFSGKPAGRSRLVASNIRINEDVPDSSFAFDFPPGIPVIDRLNSSDVKYHIWGSNGKPEATASNPDDLPMPTPRVDWRRRTWRPWVFAASVVFGLIGIGLYVHGRSRR